MSVVSKSVNKVSPGLPRVGVPTARPPRPGPSAFQAEHIPSWRGSCERYALSPVADGGRWSLLLLSPLLSAGSVRAGVRRRTRLCM
jgi:hypothetical protein